MQISWLACVVCPKRFDRDFAPSVSNLFCAQQGKESEVGFRGGGEMREIDR